jgi:hypothetical protein
MSEIVADNLDQQTDNQDQQVEQVSSPETSFSWKSQLPGDMSKSPLLQKFDDSPDGLGKAFESHIGLEKMLGHEKVPIPKGPEDVEGWNRFSKAMGVPDKAEQYGLADVDMPETMKGMTFDKGRFSELAHSFKLTPGQTKGLWEAYTKASMEAYNGALTKHQQDMTQVVNQLRGEWGDAYDTNVDLGQMVINKFASDKDMQDWLTASLTKDPKGVKFLAQIGKQFAENKIGDFQYKSFSLSPDQAQSEIDKIVQDPKHPYNNDKASPIERDRAIDYVNGLYAILTKTKQG